MKIVMLILVILACSGQVLACEITGAVRHTNPDGSQGGFKSPRATVAATVTIGPNARVCDSAWVEGNAKILDSAVVKEHAWIKSFAIIQGRAVISGRAYVEGIQNYPAIVEGNARVYGNAHIMVGTTVTDSAVVYGSANIESSTVSGNAEVCESIQIDQQFIDDDYFCAGDSVVSRIQIVPVTYKEGYANKLATKVKFMSKFYAFLPDSSRFKIYVNENELAGEEFYITREEIVLTPGAFQKEGWNDFRIEGVDQYGKKIQFEGLSLFAASGTRTFTIDNPGGVNEATMKIKIQLSAAEGDLQGIANYSNGVVTVYGLTSELDSYSVALSGVGEGSFFAERYDQLSSLPESILSSTMPTSPSARLDFDDNLSSWLLSHPSNVAVVEENGESVVKIAASETERVEVSKRFMMSRAVGQLEFGITLPTLSKVARDQAGTVEVFVISQRSKSVEWITYDVASEENPEKEAYATNDFGTDEIIYVLRIHPSLALEKTAEDTSVKEQKKGPYGVKFIPRHMTPYNGVIPTSSKEILAKDNSCSMSKSFLNNSAVSFITGEETAPFEFLSVGDVFSMGPALKENRIHADISLANATKNDVEDFFLVGKQFVPNTSGGSEVQRFRVSYKDSQCGETHFANLGGSQRFISKRTPHPLGHTFEVKFSDLLGVWSSKSKMKLHVEVVLKDGTIVASKPKEVRVLVSPNLQAGVDTMPGATDMYDTAELKFARTGGDKWFLPGYTGLLETIISHDNDWKYNDLSKLNGGPFPPHRNHQIGTDADIDFANFSMFLLDDNASVWQTPLDKIESLLKDNESVWPKIKSTLVSVHRETQNDKRNRFLYSRLQGRCIGVSGKRFIDFFDSSPDYLALLRNDRKGGHFGHLHFSFNKENSSGEPETLSLAAPTNVSLDDLRFEFNQDGRLEVRPRPGSNFNGIRVFWRFQPVEGFLSPNAKTHYGRWADNQISLTVLGTVESGTQRYLYVTFADTKTGGCTMHKIDLDTEAKLDLLRGSRNRIMEAM